MVGFFERRGWLCISMYVGDFSDFWEGKCKKRDMCPRCCQACGKER